MTALVYRFLVLLSLQFYLCSIAYAQESEYESSLGSYSFEALKVIISLVIVLGIFYFLISLFKKYSGINLKTNSAIRIVGGLSLGGKDKVVILKAGDAKLLIGVSPSGISKLHEFSHEELECSDEDLNSKSFGHHIENILNIKES